MEVIPILMKDNIFEQAKSDGAISEGTVGLQLQAPNWHWEKCFKLTISTLCLELSP